MKNDLDLYVDGIRDDLKKLYDAEYTEEEREEMENNGEPTDFYSYVADALDMEYTIDSNGEYLGARLFVTLGGPNVWIDTRHGEVGGAWGTDRASAWLPSEICEEIDNVCAEYFAMLRG